jgi:hypothetical protein
MVTTVHGIYLMDSQDLAGPIFHPLIATFLVFGITGVTEVVVKLVL